MHSYEFENVDGCLFDKFIEANPYGYAYLFTLRNFCLSQNVQTVLELGAFQGASAAAFFGGGVTEVKSVDISGQHLSDDIRSELCRMGKWSLTLADSLIPLPFHGCYDLLFVDTVHNYAHVKKELELHSRVASRFIVVHDTNYPPVDRRVLGSVDLGAKQQDIVVEFRDTKRVKNAVTEFLAESSNFDLEYQSDEGTGMMILRRL